MRSMIFPSWRRYKELFVGSKGKISVLRILQYELVKSWEFKGKVLDFGGGGKADYHSVALFEEYESVNIDETMEPTWVTEAGKPIPCPEDYYDVVLSLNTLEHIYDARFALGEMHKVLKKGGKLVCAIPFLFPIHAYPHDFFRPTDQWWEQALKDAGFEDIEITPLLWGPFSTGLVCSGVPGPLKTFRIHMSLLFDLAYVSLGRRFKKAFVSELPYYSLGFFIEAKKA